MSKDWASQRPTLWNAIARELAASDLGRLDCAYIYMRQMATDINRNQKTMLLMMTTTKATSR